ncbi:hypothetical protein RB625_31265 [Streptomyces californicus]|uniref:hypothetical protein n=1 Tax=Streptomyces californicus TaxID=67351 RepID=UPI00296F7A10|nr:hypothetical protein [Streptomyces californicus]MDW4902904.1 hypothetical protein [Streptomyces californicus]
MSVSSHSTTATGRSLGRTERRTPQLVSYDPERAQEVFQATRNRYEGREGLIFDSRTAWQDGSL